MKMYCEKCKKDTKWLVLVDNSPSYQTQYYECTKCGDREVYNKVPITRDDEKLLKGKRY